MVFEISGKITNFETIDVEMKINLGIEINDELCCSSK